MTLLRKTSGVTTALLKLGVCASAALAAPDGHFRNEFAVERGTEKRVLASVRVIARNDKNQPEFLIALFDDITDRRSLSKELENTKKFLELVVDNIPVSLIVERVSDGKYLLANRGAEVILNRRREDATGLTAADIFNPKEVYVYAMGQEPWLEFISSIKYTAESNPIVQSNRLVDECRSRGLVAERLFGEKELLYDYALAETL